MVVLTDDSQQADLGGVRLENNTWGRRDLRNGTDFEQSVGYSGMSGDGIRFDWHWPWSAPVRVLGYPEIYTGLKPWAAYPAGEALPIAVGRIETLTVQYDLDWGGDTAGFNVSFDIWLSGDPAGGPGAITHEIMVWLAAGDMVPDGPLRSAVDLPGLRADLYLRRDDPQIADDWTYVAFVPEQAGRSGEIDLAAMFALLRAEGVIGPEHWLMDIELGAEIIGGSGWMQIDALAITLNCATLHVPALQPGAVPVWADLASC